MNSNQHQDQHMQSERQYGSYTGELQQLHNIYEDQHNEQQTGSYQQGQNFQYVVYTQLQPFASGQSINLGSVAAILSYAGGCFTLRLPLDCFEKHLSS